MDDSPRIVGRHRELKQYLDWDEGDDARVAALSPILEPHLPALVEDFYEQILRHPDATRVVTGGEAQVDRLKRTLHAWIAEMLLGRPDDHYAERFWRVGRRHAEIGLDPVYVIAAFARLRSGLCRAIRESWRGDADLRAESIRSLNRRLDLDLALIQDAYQAEYGSRLQRAERLATLGQVAGGLAHELRDPLNVVKTSVYYLRNARPATPEKQDEHLGRIGRGVDRANSVITALSDFARLPAPELHPMALAGRLGMALEADPPGPEIAVEVDCPEGLAVAVDPEQFQIVLGNLIRNACEAMPEGGTLSMRARHDGRAVALEVSDTGIGMSLDLQARITEPFYSTKARGLGLGLAITRAILEKHGGALGVRSEPGRGSTFTVTIRGAAEARGHRP